MAVDKEWRPKGAGVEEAARKVPASKQGPSKPCSRQP